MDERSGRINPFAKCDKLTVSQMMETNQKQRGKERSATEVVDEKLFAQLARVYWRRWRVALYATNPQGAVLMKLHRHDPGPATLEATRALAIVETLRWGEPAVQPGAEDRLVWAVPVMHNARVVGGLVAQIEEHLLFANRSTQPSIDVRAACAELRRLAEQHNLTNAAFLEARRAEYQREVSRAEAIHAYKAAPHYDIRALYLIEEPALVTAIRKGDRAQARGILNKLLVAMIHRADERLDLIKSFFMELVVMMSRGAVEAGGVPEELLGSNFDSIARLGSITNDEDLAPWLHEMLERIMDAIHRSPVNPNDAMLQHAVRVMSERCCERIGRDDIADAAGMSPSHFSRVFHKHFGRTFNDALLQMRADRVAELLASTDKPLKIIALECGLADQSHLTKLFRRRYRTTPRQYRVEHKNTKY